MPMTRNVIILETLKDLEGYLDDNWRGFTCGSDGFDAEADLELGLLCLAIARRLSMPCAKEMSKYINYCYSKCARDNVWAEIRATYPLHNLKNFLTAAFKRMDELTGTEEEPATQTFLA